MAYGNNDSTLKRTKIKESKNGTPYQYCYIEHKGQLLKINISEAQKEKRSESDGDYWVKVTDYGPANKGRGGSGGSFGSRGGRSSGGGSFGGGRRY